MAPLRSNPVIQPINLITIPPNCVTTHTGNNESAGKKKNGLGLVKEIHT
jgi:hypothetical protein